MACSSGGSWRRSRAPAALWSIFRASFATCRSSEWRIHARACGAGSETMSTGYRSMIVEYAAGDGLRLVEPGDFRSFKLRIKDAHGQDLPATAGITPVDERNVLIAISLVPTLPGCPDDECWRAGYLAMIESARKYGWIDAQASAIRVHVERI